MSTIIGRYSENESENDDANDESATQPLLLLSTKQHMHASNFSTINVKPAKNYYNHHNDSKHCTKHGHFVHCKLFRCKSSRSHCNKFNGINIGLFLCFFLIVVYLCVSSDLIVDKMYSSLMVNIQPSPIASFLIATPSPSENHSLPAGYLVWSPSCHIRALDPFAADAMELFHREKYEGCSTSEPITRIEMNWTTSEAKLIYNHKPKWYSIFSSPNCCYSEILRSGTADKADSQFELSTCRNFSETITLPATIEFIFVKCESGGKMAYNNTHAIIRDRPEIRQRLNNHKAKRKSKRPLSVLMLAIDSISQLNLLRAMPKTAQHLHDTGWFELQGYNKIDDNTLPNVMAILAGYNMSLVYDKCDPTVLGKVDECPFIWNDFKSTGYTTSYGEDEMLLGTFNYEKPGFLTPPTDYYMRPYMLAAEKQLAIRIKHQLTFCLGHKHSADHVYDYAMDFATHYKRDASFGLYWTNTFSHNNISDPSSMDFKVNDYLKDLETRGILNESMVVFFSDHGLRFGPIRLLFTGWMEERLPFMFIHLPKWFQQENPDFVRALKINRNRLTNPYDLHMTLKHILQLSNPEQVMMPAASCPKCQSLFTEIPWNRSCDEASIASHWCTCQPYQPHDKNDKVVKNAVKFVLNDINRNVNNFTDDHKRPACAQLKFKKMFDVSKAKYRHGTDSYDDYLLQFEVSPNDAWFESTVRFRNTTGFEISGSVSRLDFYGHQGDCIDNGSMRKYCICMDKVKTKKRKG